MGSYAIWRPMTCSLFRGLALLIVATVAVAPHAVAPGEPQPQVIDGPSGREGHYVQSSPGTVFFFDRETSTLTLSYAQGGVPPPHHPDDPGYDAADPLFVLGYRMDFAEAGEALPHAICLQTFCLELQVRRVGNFEASWLVQWHGWYNGYQTPTYTIGWNDFLVNYGQPVVTGAETTVGQQTVATDCFVKATIRLRDVSTGQIFQSPEEVFQCSD